MLKESHIAEYHRYDKKKSGKRAGYIAGDCLTVNVGGADGDLFFA